MGIERSRDFNMLGSGKITVIWGIGIDGHIGNLDSGVVVCDETRPACNNCVKHGIECDLTPPAASLAIRPLQRVRIPRLHTGKESKYVSIKEASPTLSVSSSSSSSRNGSSPSLPMAMFTPADRLLELRLFHHYRTMASRSLLPASFSSKEFARHPWSTWVSTLAVSTPSLMDAIIGFSAFHLRLLSPGDKTISQASHKYMARAIVRHSKELQAGINERNVETLFATSVFVALHASVSQRFLAEDQKIPMHWFRPYRGVKALLDTGWKWIKKSQIGSVVQATYIAGPLQESQDKEKVLPFAFLLKDLESDKLDKDTIKSYESTVIFLSWMYTAPNPTAIFKFPMMVSNRFVELLEAKDPRTLTIVGYYFMLLKRLSHIWWLQGVVEREFRTLMTFIPKDWLHVMDWAVKEFDTGREEEHPVRNKDRDKDSRGLVSRARLNESATSSPARGRNTEPPEAQTALPPYEPPSCPLTASGKQALARLGLSYGSRFTKYRSDIEEAIKTITTCATEGHDRLYERKHELERAAKRREKGAGDDEKTDYDREIGIIAASLERKVEDMTKKAEKALRDLIDYKGELEMQQTILQEVNDNIPDQTTQSQVSRGERRRRRPNIEDDEDEEESMDVDSEEEALQAPATNVSILSPVELLKKAKEDYAKAYSSQTMHSRYAENNDYKGFKRQIHDALHPGPEAPPVPHASTWFPNENGTSPMARRRRLAADDPDEEEDDVVIAKATTNLKCPLTLQMFEVPYSNNICNHSFEKSAIIEYYNENAVAFAEPRQGGRKRGQPPVGPRKVQCPQLGCEAMLELKDFYEDQLLLRQVKRAKRQAAAGMDDDDVDNSQLPPRGTQMDPEDIDDADDIDEDEDDEGEADRRRQYIAKVKRERMSRDPSIAPSRHLEHSEDDEDEEMED
ncbi:hypothetical protein B7463_g1247, partial [Scytalidium lignicola]